MKKTIPSSSDTEAGKLSEEGEDAMVETSVEARTRLINRLQEGGKNVLPGLAEAMIRHRGPRSDD